MVRVVLVALTVLVVFLGAACQAGDGGPAAPSTSVQRPSATATLSGPNLTIEPRSGPPGTTITISGAGWAPGETVAIGGDGRVSGSPYASVTANESGSFRAVFILERQPDGSSLSVGRFDLIARSSSTEVRMPFQVQTPRPVGNPSQGG
jgi:hypothetical protein